MMLVCVQCTCNCLRASTRETIHCRNPSCVKVYQSSCCSKSHDKSYYFVFPSRFDLESFEYSVFSCFNSGQFNSMLKPTSEEHFNANTAALQSCQESVDMQILQPCRALKRALPCKYCSSICKLGTEINQPAFQVSQNKFSFALRNKTFQLFEQPKFQCVFAKYISLVLVINRHRYLLLVRVPVISI